MTYSLPQRQNNKQTKKKITYEKQIVLERVESSSTIRQARLPASEVLPLSNEAVWSVDPNRVALSVKSNIFLFSLLAGKCLRNKDKDQSVQASAFKYATPVQKLPF